MSPKSKVQSPKSARHLGSTRVSRVQFGVPPNCGGARRSRRFNLQNVSGLDFFCATPKWMLKRAKARAPFANCAALNIQTRHSPCIVSPVSGETRVLPEINR